MKSFWGHVSSTSARIISSCPSTVRLMPTVVWFRFQSLRIRRDSRSIYIVLFVVLSVPILKNCLYLNQNTVSLLITQYRNAYVTRMEDDSWFSFKHENGSPIVFYNSETGEHRWGNGFKHVKCSKATLDEVPPSYDDFNHEDVTKKNFRYIKTEPEKCNFPPKKTLTQLSKDAATNTDNFSLEDRTLCSEKLDSTKEKDSLTIPGDENLFDIYRENDVIPMASPPGNSFFTDSNKDEDAGTDHEYGQSPKESLIHNLFAMELSSVLSYEDLQKDGCHETSRPNMVTPHGSPQLNIQTKEMVSNNESLEKSKMLEPPMMAIKVEQDTDGFQEVQSFGNTENPSSDFSLVDLLPKKRKRKFNCRLCKKSFKTRSSLQRHEMLVHSDEIVIKPAKSRPHACTICEKRFAEANCLKKHLRTHTGEKPYRCPFCGKGFAQSQNLNKHKYIHIDLRPHKCKDCGKTFRQHSHLARHKLIHTGEKPYQCAECPKNYRTRSHLVRHFKSSNHKGLIDNSKKSLSPLSKLNTEEFVTRNT